MVGMQIKQANGNEHAVGKTILNIGFSGTREGMTQAQMGVIASTLSMLGGTFHHGDCIGADAEAHDIAAYLGYKIVGHPPSNPEFRAYKQCNELVAEKPYLIRNKDIVLASDVLLAAPKSAKETGGTWNTINYARKLIEGGMQKQCYIVLPNGDVGVVVYTPHTDLKNSFNRAKLDS